MAVTFTSRVHFYLPRTSQEQKMRFNTIHVCLTVPGAIIPTSNHADIQTLNLPVINMENTMGFNYESVAETSQPLHHPKLNRVLDSINIHDLYYVNNISNGVTTNSRKGKEVALTFEPTWYVASFRHTFARSQEEVPFY